MENIGANIGEMLAVAMAEGGMTLANAACRYTNMTDACCLAGMKFPEDIGAEEQRLVKWFNEATVKMCEWGSETAEEARYCLIGDILVKMAEGKSVTEIREHIEGKLATILKEVRRMRDQVESKGEDEGEGYGFDGRSIYLRENNWGDRRGSGDGGDELDWWTRRAG